jgi:hypothetical protein
MPLEFKRSWSNEEVESFRDSWVRFVETEMLPQDAEARRRGHVGHDLWRRAGDVGPPLSSTAASNSCWPAHSTRQPRRWPS